MSWQLRNRPRRTRTLVTAFLLTASLVMGLLVSSAWAADGDLDPAFDGDGKVVSDLGVDERAEALAVQPDGRLVIAGHQNPARRLDPTAPIADPAETFPTCTAPTAAPEARTGPQSCSSCAHPTTARGW